jgi:hypothetical protein
LTKIAEEIFARSVLDTETALDLTNAQIADLVGPTVASLVAEVTDDKSLLKEVRKDNQIADAPHKSDGASVIKLADKISNLLAIANSPPPWSPDRKRAYVEWARSVASGLPFKPAGLLARFEEAARLATGAGRPTATTAISIVKNTYNFWYCCSIRGIFLTEGFQATIRLPKAPPPPQRARPGR